MWLIRSVVVASVLMMLICDLESKPQTNPCVDGIPDDAFISLIEGVPTANCTCPVSGAGQCKCVHINLCCDEPSEEECPFPCYDDRIVLGTDDQVCRPDLLTKCCEKECHKKKCVPPTSTNTTTATNNTHDPNDAAPKCGIRNPEGYKVTIEDFKEGQAQYGEFPWMVALLFEGNHSYVGGGSLLHPRVVLTAAHKVHDKSGSLVARIGDWNLAEEANTEIIQAQEIKVKDILFHPDFNSPRLMEYNVALLILEKDAVLSETVSLICLPQVDQIFDGSNCTVTGWGKDLFGKAGQYQKIMRKVPVPAVSHSECEQMLRKTRLGQKYNLHSSFNCAGGKGEDACEGDGGSPLVCPNPDNPKEYLQMGVVSWGIGCGTVGHPGVYGSIPKTVEWINKELDAVEFDPRLPALPAQ